MAVITIDPATRLEGHLKVKVNRDDTTKKVINAQSSGMMFRGFENLLIGKDQRDAAVITQRVCGVCPISHAMAACLAGETAAGMTAPANARIIRNLILGANFLQSHILSFYHLTALTYVKGPNMPPWTPAYQQDMRLSAAENQLFVDHYVQALTARRQAHEMLAILGGKMPHVSVFEFGGVTVVPDGTMLASFRSYLDQVTAFIDNVYRPDVELLGQRYPEYYQIGRGYGNLLAFGVFDLTNDGASKLLRRGRVANGSTTVETVGMGQILEQTKYSWYVDNGTGQNPSQGATQPSADKAGAYSWLKAPRYAGVPYETGALARMWVNGDYRRGISVMDRHQARALEASKIAHAMQGWLGQINLANPVYSAYTRPVAASGRGFTEAPRGALGHWVSVANSVVSSYQILTPTCWNFSPRDVNGQPGPAEKALMGTSVANNAEPVEVLRVVQSFDPCLSCAVH